MCYVYLLIGRGQNLTGRHRDTGRNTNGATAGTPVGQAGTPARTPPGQQTGAGATGHVRRKPLPQNARTFARTSHTTRTQHNFPVGRVHGGLTPPTTDWSPGASPKTLRVTFWGWSFHGPEYQVQDLFGDLQQEQTSAGVDIIIATRVSALCRRAHVHGRAPS